MSSATKVLGIRREDYGTLWERRAPLNPDQVRALVQSGVKVLIEVCNKRAYAIQV